jgi:hypothetical protein
LDSALRSSLARCMKSGAEAVSGAWFWAFLVALVQCMPSSVNKPLYHWYQKAVVWK